MRQIRRQIDRKAVHRHPAPHAHADRADLGFATVDIPRPDADPALCAPGIDPDVAQRGDHPAFERLDETADIAFTLSQIKQHIADPLSRPMIGVASAATGFDHFEARVEQLARHRAGPGGVDRWVFEQPDQLLRLAKPDRRVARFHGRQRLAIGYPVRAATDFDCFGGRGGHGRLRGETARGYQGRKIRTGEQSE